MIRTLLFVQLGFNALMLIGLLVALKLSWRRSNEPAKPRAVGKPALKHPTAAAPNIASEPSAAIADLVHRAEQQELAAEAALRARLSRYRTRAAGE